MKAFYKTLFVFILVLFSSVSFSLAQGKKPNNSNLSHQGSIKGKTSVPDNKHHVMGKSQIRSTLGYLFADFEDTAFPPAGWTLDFTGNQFWTRDLNCSGYGLGTAAAEFNFYNAYTGTMQSLITSTFGASVAGDSLKFDHAYASYAGENDQLEIDYSTDGGTTFTMLILLNGGSAGELVTAPPTLSFFIPNSTQWGSKIFGLPIGTNKLQFKAISAYGNNLYLDNIKVGTAPANDIGTSSIDMADSYSPGTVTPMATVRNYGSAAQTAFNVSIVITPGGYTSTKTVTNLAPGAAFQITFDNWVVTVGNFNVKVYTQLTGDGEPTNDTLNKAVSGTYGDVGTYSIDMADSYKPGTVSPMATVINYGSVFQTAFNVSMVITPGGYTSTKTVTNLSPGYAFQVTFDNWVVAPGNYNVKVYTQLIGDGDPTNDTLNKAVSGTYGDVGTFSIDMSDSCTPGTVSPMATVMNYGSVFQTAFNVSMVITPGGYISTKTVTNLYPGYAFQVTFDNWVVALGNYNVKVYTQLIGDGDPTNDTLNKAVSGTYGDVGTSSINMSDSYTPGTVYPIAGVRNFGSSFQTTFNVSMVITPGGYTSTKTVTDLPTGATYYITFDNWTPTTGTYNVKTYTQSEGDSNPTNDTLTKAVNVFNVNGVSLISIGTPYFQNFDGLSSAPNIWIDSISIPGWYSNRATYNADNGNVNSGGLYSYGTTLTTERSLGAISSISVPLVRFAVNLINNTGTTINSFNVSYTGEQWRQNINSQALTFDYQVGASSITAGNWTPASTLNFTALKTGGAGALDGNAPGNNTSISSTIDVSVPPGQAIWLRWSKTGSSSPGLAIDNLSIIPNAWSYPHFTLSLANDAQTAANVYEFDVYLLRTGTEPFELCSAQLGFTFNNAIKNDGTLEVSYVPGSTDTSIVISGQKNTSFDQTTAGVIKIEGKTAPGGPGTGAIISASGQGTRIGRLKLTNSVPFAALQSNVQWCFDEALYPTHIVAYVHSFPFDIDSNGVFNYAGSVQNSVLPVELSSFTSAAQGRTVVLNWSTKSEKNSDRFEIERSLVTNGPWSIVGTVKASVLSNSPRQYSYTDKNLQSGKYQYRLKMIDNNGSFEYSKIIETEVAVPKNFELSQNYPNPFNPSTKINYTLPFDSKVTLEVYNITGERIGQLVNEEQSAGYYSVDFTSSFLSKSISSGVYFYRINTVDEATGKDFSAIKKMMLLK